MSFGSRHCTWFERVVILSCFLPNVGHGVFVCFVRSFKLLVWLDFIQMLLSRSGPTKMKFGGLSRCREKLWKTAKGNTFASDVLALPHHMYIFINLCIFAILAVLWHQLSGNSGASIAENTTSTSTTRNKNGGVQCVQNWSWRKQTSIEGIMHGRFVARPCVFFRSGFSDLFIPYHFSISRNMRAIQRIEKFEWHFIATLHSKYIFWDSWDNIFFFCWKRLSYAATRSTGLMYFCTAQTSNVQQNLSTMFVVFCFLHHFFIARCAIFVINAHEILSEFREYFQKTQKEWRLNVL